MRNTGIEYSSTEHTPTVREDFANLLPPLSDEQLSLLEGDILRNGCYTPIIVNEAHMIVDGHNRAAICHKHGIPYRMAVFSFQDDLEAKQWALDTQKDYTLAFRGGGVATILPEKDSFVPCLLWSITPACEQSLDRYEGYPNLYHKEMVMLPLLNRCRAPAFATTRIRLFGISIWSSGCWKTNDIREKMDTRSSSRKNCLRGHS